MARKRKRSTRQEAGRPVPSCASDQEAPAQRPPTDEQFHLPPVDAQAHLARQVERNPFAEDLGLRARLVQQEDGEYSEEFILQAVHQMSLARVPCDQMARRFGVSLRTVMRWRATLREKFREEAQLLDPQAFIGRTLKHYEAISAAAWQLYVTGQNHGERVRGLDAARACEADLQRFMHLAGFYDAVKFRPSIAETTDAATRNAELLRHASQQLLNAFSDLEEKVE